MIATRMFWELRSVRKLTAPPVVSGTAATKNKMRRARNSHAQMLLRKRIARCARVRAPEGAPRARGVREARSFTGAPSGRRPRKHAPLGERNDPNPLLVAGEGRGEGDGVQETASEGYLPGTW